MKKINQFLLGICLSLLLSIPVNAQVSNQHSLSGGTGKTVYELCNGVKFQGFHSVDSFEILVRNITNLIGLKPNFILVPCPNIKNCAAMNYEDKLRYIVYDKEFMQDIVRSVGTNWSNTMILAHEIGHHLNGHTLRQGNKEETRAEELEADEFAGFILGKLGANIYQAVAAMDGLHHPDCDLEYFSDHPCKEKRVAAIRTGWDKANGTSILTSLKLRTSQPNLPKMTLSTLQGTWYTELDNERNTDGFMPLTITFSDPKTIHYRFYNATGDTVINEYDSKFQLVNDMLLEELPGSATGQKAKAKVEMLSNRAFLLTIIDNGVEGYQGLKRVYVKLKEDK